MPPFEHTQFLRQIVDGNGVDIKPAISAKLDKAFFKVDQEWTCYRRNYFSVACSFTLKPKIPDYVYLSDGVDSSQEQIVNFAMSISAVTDFGKADTKPVRLVQHTSKRDQDPLTVPNRMVLEPLANSSTEEMDFMELPLFQETATFDRIQFAAATAKQWQEKRNSAIFQCYC